MGWNPPIEGRTYFQMKRLHLRKSAAEADSSVSTTLSFGAQRTAIRYFPMRLGDLSKHGFVKREDVLQTNLPGLPTVVHLRHSRVIAFRSGTGYAYDVPHHIWGNVTKSCDLSFAG
jgi:hypothetical protein